MRKNILRSLLILAISASATTAMAQPAIARKYVEHPGWGIGVNFGMSDLWGDVGTKSPIDHYGNELYWTKPHFMGGLMMRYVAHPSVGLRFNVNYGTVYATDEWNINKAKDAKSIEDDAFQRYLRNQDARANIWEGSFMVELIPLRWNTESKAAQRRMQPYVAGGVGVFHFRPQTSLIQRPTGRKEWVYTKELRLEGEGVPNSGAIQTNLWQTCVPLGLGLRWDVGNNISFGFEYMYRITFMDRLDNVSSYYLNDAYYDRYLSAEDAAVAKQVADKSWYIEPSVEHKYEDVRGNKDVKDGYSTISVQFIYKLESNKIPWWY